MTVEPQELKDDPIIAALGITKEAQPVVPPTDQVFGHYHDDDPKFRLYHKTLRLYMRGPKSRILGWEQCPGRRTKLYLRADGNYDADIEIGNTRLPGEAAAPGPVEPDYQRLYTMYASAKTTPWHD